MGSTRCDVAVIGAGPAGLSAAVAAARAGKAVVIIEATGQLGGNAPFSTGYIAFAGTSLQRKSGIEDSAEAYACDMEREALRAWSGKQLLFNRELALSYASQTSEAYEFLVDLGVEFERFISRPRQHTRTRMLAFKSPGQLPERIGPVLEAAGTRTLYHSRATALLGDSDRVRGVALATDGRDREISADSVIVTTGGFQASQLLRRRFTPTMDPTAPYPGIDTAVGDGHLMLESVGARLVNMDLIPELVRVASRFVECSISINSDGNRFHNEAGPYHERLAALNAQPGGVGYYVCDAAAAEQHAQLIEAMPAAAELADDLAGVARLVGASTAAVEDTIAAWNRIVVSGVDADPDFGRVIFPSPRVGIERAPFSVVPMIGGIATTVGGAVIDERARVVDQGGRPIPGLFAAGDTVGVLTPATGLGGVHLSSAVTMGRVAGLEA